MQERAGQSMSRAGVDCLTSAYDCENRPSSTDAISEIKKGTAGARLSGPQCGKPLWGFQRAASNSCIDWICHFSSPIASKIKCRFIVDAAKCGTMRNFLPYFPDVTVMRFDILFPYMLRALVELCHGTE